MRVVITVKTYPNPSTEYLETVCVAGVRVDVDPPVWVRLYPIPFRLLDKDKRFSKYEVLAVDTSPQVRDRRPESLRPRLDSIQTVGTLASWAQRRGAIGQLIGATTTCELNHGVELAKGSAPSLGCVRPADVGRVYVKRCRPWTDDVLRKAALAADGTLFSPGVTPLRPPPFEIRFPYRCESSGCPGHDQKTMDWEAGWAAVLWSQREGRAAAERMAVQKWGSLVSADKDPAFFLGNQFQHPGSFSILGNWWPVREPEPLF